MAAVSCLLQGDIHQWRVNNGKYETLQLNRSNILLNVLSLIKTILFPQNCPILNDLPTRNFKHGLFIGISHLRIVPTD